MLFTKKQPRRLTDVEIDEIRKRVQTFQSRLVESPPKLIEVFASVQNDGFLRS